MAYFTSDYLEFFKELAGNNNKEWFDDNRKRYKSSVFDPFKAFVGEAIDFYSKKEGVKDLEAKSCMFRVNRDIRFSPDKTPYKTMMSAIVSATGKKDKNAPGIYFEFSPEHVAFYGGAYMPDKDQLLDIRMAIADDLKGFQAVLNEKKFKDVYGEIHGEQHKRVPAEFKEAAEAQPLIANKQFYYFNKLKPEVLLQEDLLDVLKNHYEAAAGMRNFLAKATGY